MKLKFETILDIYTHRNTKVLCQIKVQPSKDKLNREWKNTCRCITQEQWNSFDKELKMILEVLKDKRDKWNDEIISTFSIKPNIEVKVQKSKLSSKMFYNFMGGLDDIASAEVSIDNIRKIKQIGHVLEFILDFKQQPPSISPVEETQEYQPKPKTTSPDNILNSPLSYEPYTPSKKIYPSNSLEKETQKYEPKPKTSPDNELNGPLSYKPYTPSQQKYRANSLDGIKTPVVDFLEHKSFEDPYLPKSINNTTKKDYPIPAYKPAPIKEKRTSIHSQTSNHSCNNNKVISETDEELLSPLKFRTTRSNVLKKKSKHEIEYIPKSHEIINAPAYFPTPIDGKNTIKNDSQSLKCINKDKELRKRISKRLEYREKLSSKESNQDKANNSLEIKESTSSRGDDKSRMADTNKFYSNKGIKHFQEASPENVSVLKITVSSNTESATMDVSASKKTTKEKHKISQHDTNNSGRSPFKSKRLRKEQSSKIKYNKKEFKTQNSSPTNKELFGTDYEDDDDSNNDATNKKLSISHPNVKILKS